MQSVSIMTIAGRCKIELFVSRGTGGLDRIHDRAIDVLCIGTGDDQGTVHKQCVYLHSSQYSIRNENVYRVQCLRQRWSWYDDKSKKCHVESVKFT